MASLSDLRTSITQMSYDEALLVIRKCRDSRRIPKKSFKSKSKSTKAKRVLNISDIVKVLTPEQKAQMRRELLGE